MSYLKDKFAAMNNDFPEESVALVVQTARDLKSLYSAKLDKTIESLKKSVQSNKKEMEIWKKGSELINKLAPEEQFPNLPKSQEGREVLRWLREMAADKKIKAEFTSLTEVRIF